MFTLEDVKGIELERMIAYITERNKEQKIYRQGQITSAVFDLANRLHAGIRQDQNYSLNTFSRPKKDQKDSDTQRRNSIDMIKESEEVQDQRRQDNVDELEESGQNGIMVTKPASFNSCSMQSQKKIKKNQFNNIPNPKQSSPPAPINMKFIILSLKNHTIDHLKQQFIYNDNKITLERFLYLMKQCISYDKRREYEISYQLIKLFEEIDIDCNKSIDWEEFLEYLACFGWTSTGSQMQAGFGVMGDGGSADKAKKASLIVETWNENNKHRKNALLKIVEIQKLDMLCLVQTKNFTLTFTTTRGEKFYVTPQTQNPADSQANNQQKPQTNPASLPSSPSSNQKTHTHQSSAQKLASTQFSLNHIDHRKVLSIDYSEHEKLFGVLQTDRKVHFIQEGDIQKSWGKVQGAGNQIDIMYLPLHKMWLLKRINQYLDIFCSPKDKLNKERIVFKPHETQAITAIKQLKQPFSLITAGIDGKIKIWSLASRQLLIELKPIGEQEIMSLSQVKTKGVKGIDTLNMGIQNYFCSWTFTTEIMLWLPSTSVSKPYIGKLHGHSGIVESCEFIKPQHCSKQLVVSIDNKKVVKIWSVQKLECLQTLLHEGHGCRVKCLSSRPVFVVFDKVIQFNRIKLSSLVMGGEKAGSNNQESGQHVQGGIQKGMAYEFGDGGKMPVKGQFAGGKSGQTASEWSKFVQVEFCNHNILLLVLMRTELKVINIQTGRIQAVFEPSFKDEEEFVHMSIKINRRLFAISTLGYVYYIKLDDASLIKRFQIQLGANEAVHHHTNQFHASDGPNWTNDGVRVRSTKNQKYHRLTGKKESVINDKYNEADPFSPMFVYYHSASKMLVVVVELDNVDSSVLVTYNQSTGYDFQKMKQIEFPQSNLKHLFFFTKSDLLLISSLTMLTIWDFTKLNIVNKIDFNHNKSSTNTNRHAQDASLNQPYIKHITINETNTNNILLIMVLTKNDQFTIYELNPVDYSFRHSIILEIPQKLKSIIRSFYLICTNNQDVQTLINNKFNPKYSKKIIKNSKEKHVKFNFSVEDSENDPILTQPTAKKDDQNSISISSSIKKSTGNLKNSHKSSLATKGKTLQQNLSNKNSSNKKTKIIYFLTKDGSIFGYYLNDIILLLKKDIGRGQLEGDSKRMAQGNFNNNSLYVANIDQNMQKRYAAHKIRETRKASIKQLSNKLQTIGPIDVEEYLIIQKELIAHSWNLPFSQLYPDLLYGISQKNQLILFKPNGQPLGEWNLKSILPKRWAVTYQLLPKVIQRLNKLQEIIRFYKQSSQLSTFKVSSYSIFPTQINGSNAQKILFLANRFLQQSDLIELRDYVKTSSVKLLNMSKKNLLYKKNYGEEQEAKKIISLKKLDDLPQNLTMSKKKSVTISKNIIEQNSDTDSKRSPSMSKVVGTQALNLENNKGNKLYLSQFGNQKLKQSQMKNNLFQKKFQQKLEQENRLKVDRRYIEKQIEKTLKQVKKLQLKAEVQNNKALAQKEAMLKSINIKQTINDKKQHLENLTQQTSNHDGYQNASQPIFISPINHLMIEKELQRKEIEKNINFVKRIQESIEKVELGLTMGNGFNFVQIPVSDPKMTMKLNLQYKKSAKDHTNNKNNKDQHSQSKHQPSVKNSLKPQQSIIRKRKVSISSNVYPSQNVLILDSAQSSQNAKSINKLNNLQLGTVNDILSKGTGQKQTDISYRIMPIGMNGIKKKVDFSTNNKVVMYESNNNENGINEREKGNLNEFQRNDSSNHSLINKSSKRSFSAIGRSPIHQNSGGYNQTAQKKANFPSRSHLRSASNNNQKEGQHQLLSKSRSLYGTQFAKQKQMAMTNFKQGMRDFENFYKRFGNGWGTDNSKTNKNSRIKLN